MSKKKPDEAWLTDEAREGLYPEWQHRLLSILQDMATWSQLKYAYAIGKDGVRYTHSIGPGGIRVKDETYSSSTFFALSGIIEDFLSSIEYPTSAQVTIELEDEILTIASCGELYMVASFYSGVPKGYMTMKLAKRISHLRVIWRMEHDETH